MKEQERIQNQLQQNIAELLSINGDLNRELESYRTNTETITIQARDLGFISKNEKMLFIEERSPGLSVKTPGDFIIPEIDFRSVEAVFRITAMILCSLLLFFGILKYYRLKTEP